MIMYRYVCAYVHIKEGILEEGVVATTSKKWANEIQSNEIYSKFNSSV